MPLTPSSASRGTVWLCAAAISLGAILASIMVGPIDSGRAVPVARVAKVIALTERATMRITTSKGSNLVAQGQATGTLTGSASVHLVILSASRMTASFAGSSRSGTLEGRGTYNYGTSGSIVHYSGTVNITRGTGSYEHASSRGIHVEGTMNRQRRIVAMNINGNMRV
jgi:hypothetical protein